MGINQNSSVNRLVLELKKGSVLAFNIIYARYALQLLNYVGAATERKEDAEEIVHDIFINLWEKRDKLANDTDLSSYLFSIAYRKRIDAFRRSVNSPVFEDYLNFQNQLAHHETHQLEYKEFLALLKRALQSLPRRNREIITLSRIKGLSNDDIAQSLHISEKTRSEERRVGKEC